MTAKDGGREAGARPAQGMRWDDLSGEERVAVLKGALDYRGDVTLLLDDGASVTGYVFDVQPGGDDPHLRMYASDAGEGKVRVPLPRIVGCEISGRDTADGRSWEAWVARWEERKRLLAEGIDPGDIEPKPQEL